MKNKLWSTLQENPSLGKRFIQIHVGKKLRGPLDKLGRRYLVLKLWRFDRARRIAIEDTFDAVLKLAKKSDFDKKSCLQKLSKLSLYIILGERDLHSLKRDIFTSSQEWRRRLAIRHSILIMYEMNFSKVIDQEIYSSMESLHVNSIKINNLKVSLKRFRRLKEKFDKKYSRTRTELVAHRLGDPIEYYDAIVNLSEKEFYDDFGELYVALGPVVDAITQLISEVSLREDIKVFSARSQKGSRPTLPS